MSRYLRAVSGAKSRAGAARRSKSWNQMRNERSPRCSVSPVSEVKRPVGPVQDGETRLIWSSRVIVAVAPVWANAAEETTTKHNRGRSSRRRRNKITPPKNKYARNLSQLWRRLQNVCQKARLLNP